MKKIISILFFATVFSAANSQSNRHDGDERNTDNTSYRNARVDQNDHDRKPGIFQRDMQVQRISSQYDRQIQQISRNRSLSRREKKFAIRALQAQKADDIRRVYVQYSAYNYHSKDGYNGHGRGNR